MKPLFCSSCGTKLNESTGKCPVCDRQDNAVGYDKTAFYNGNEEMPAVEAKTEKNSKMPKKKLMLIAAVLGFCFVLVFAATVSFIVFSDSDISVFNNKDDESETLQKKNDRNESAGTKGQFDESDVPEGAVSFEGHRYYIIDDPDVNDWDSAKRYCDNVNGYLATITSQEENDFVFDYISEQADYSSVYFGMSDRSSEGEWKWTNGERVSYTAWAHNEPQSKNSSFDFARFCMDKENGMWYSGGFGEASSEHIGVTVVSATATSVLVEENITHDAEKIADGLLSTSWVEGVYGYGVGESVTLYFDGVYNVNGFVINAGYQRSEYLYGKNSRPAELLLTFSDGSTENVTLDDIFRSQHIVLSSPVMTDSVTLTILSSYRGSTFDDTAIAEISFSAEEKKPVFLCEWGTY